MTGAIDPDILEHSGDMRAFLRETLAARCARNPRYSLRAFARQLGTDHSTLSQILRGRRPLAVRTIARFSEKLRLPDSARDRFIVAERTQRRHAASAPARLERLGRELSTLLSDWRHFAILELTRLDAFTPDSRWIARVLGSTVDDTNVAVQRLLRFGLLQMTSASSWTAISPVVPVSLDGFLEAVAARLPALHAVDGRPQPARGDVRPGDRAETTIAVDSRRVDQAIELMDRCRTDVIRLLTTGDRKDDVYRLSISLVPVTTTKP
ncbi:MAG: TIGR02147 family protein [Gemmatimonadetes bacterium]|nr:TIGR02147 family protein [Gemmatimonadota bacterium]